MALHRGRSSVQSENLTKKAKKGVDGNVQGKPTRVIFGGAPKRALTESPICKEPAFAKQLVPSKHELQNLRSNLSACIAAGNAHGAQRTPCKAPPPPSSLRFERVLGSRNPGVVSSKLTPCDSVYERVLEMSMSPTGRGTDDEGDNPQTNANFGGATPSLPIAKRKLLHTTPSHAPLQPAFLPYSSVEEQRQPNPYEGCYYVVPDIYQPAEIQTGFPSSTPPKAPTSPKQEQVLEGPTVIEIWDAHVAQLAEYREAPAVLDSPEELASHLDALEDVRAERLRYNTGHCFGALAGDVYPYHGGLIF